MKSYFLIFYMFSWFWQEEIITLNLRNSRNSEIQNFHGSKGQVWYPSLQNTKTCVLASLSLQKHKHLFCFMLMTQSPNLAPAAVVSEAAILPLYLSVTTLPVQTSHFWFQTSSLRPSHQSLKRAELHSTGILWQVEGKRGDTWASCNSWKQSDLGNSVYTQSIFTDWPKEPPL